MGNKAKRPKGGQCQSQKQPKRIDLETAYGFLGGQLSRQHISDLVYDLAELIEQARDGREDRVLPILESIAETFSNCSDKFERALFIPAITEGRKLSRARIIDGKEATAKNERRWRTETLSEFVNRGGKIKQLAVGQGKQVNVSLEDLGL